MNAYEKFKAAHDIRATIESYCGKAKGDKVVCPFHNEKSGSLHIYDDTQSFYCFGCAASGDVIDFIERMTGQKPSEIVTADTLPIAHNAPVARSEARQHPEFVYGGQSALDWHEALLSEHHDIIDYLRERGIDDERIAVAPLGILERQSKRWIAIPHLHDGILTGVKLRHDPFVQHKKGERYKSLTGSRLRGRLWNDDVAILGWFPMVLTGAVDSDLIGMMDGIDFPENVDRTERLYLCDAELDALAIWSLLKNPSVVAIPDGGFKAHHARMVASVDELIFVTDRDESGAGLRATDAAIALCGRGEMVMPPAEKDTGDYYRAGGRNISWLL